MKSLADIRADLHFDAVDVERVAGWSAGRLLQLERSPHLLTDTEADTLTRLYGYRRSLRQSSGQIQEARVSIELPDKAIELLREGARSGKSTTELIKCLRRALELDAPCQGRGKVVSLFAAAFGTRLSKTTILGGWAGFGYEGSNLTDEYIDEYFEKFLNPYRNCSNDSAT